MAPAVVVEEVTGGKALARFVELPQALHGADPRFAPLLMAWERYRLDPRRNPFFEGGDAAYFIARRQGRPVGRITAHLAHLADDGQLGFWWTDDDPLVARALVDTARTWLDARGCRAMTGPVSFTEDEEVGVQVAGHHTPGLTGRPWHPPHLARLLEEHGLEAVADHPTWRLPTMELDPEPSVGGDLPGQAGAYADRRLVLPGIAAVPDVADALRGAGLRSALALAKQAGARRWDTCTVVRCSADPGVAVPALQRAAGRAGYRSVVAPWSPDPTAEPEAVHRTYRLRW
ncbi:MAG: hypothetical protein ABIY48_00140 [Acidimicrobiales bacterium]